MQQNQYLAFAILFSVVFVCLSNQSVCQDNNQHSAAEQTVDERQLPTGRAIDPAGDLISFYGRPVDIALSNDKEFLLVKDRQHLRVIHTKSWELVQSLTSPDGASLWGLAVDKNNRVYFTNSKSSIHVFEPNPDTEKSKDEPFQFQRSIELPNDSFPCGIQLSEDQSMIYVCLSKKNSVAFIDLSTNKIVNTIDVGVAPFDLTHHSGFLFVSNLGGQRPASDDRTAPSAGTETRVDERGIANSGSVTVIELATAKAVRQIETGLQPSVLIPGLTPATAIVCETNNDTIGLIAADSEKSKSHSVKPDEKLPFGSMPSAIKYVKDSYAVALAGNNAVALFNTSADSAEPRLAGLLPTAWYPVALELDDNYLYVACTKGVGSRSVRRDKEKGWNSHDHKGSVQRIPRAWLADESQLKELTKKVHKLSRLKQVVENSQPATTNSTAAPKPVPTKLGDPSVFKHVIYVIKENRTFDQVFGDIEEARSDPKLCIFPEEITPNHHALARRFGVLDNYYCNGILSADGHSWATEGNVTPYLERAFGGFARSYTFGDDPITYSSSGFLWDHILAAGLSFRNYGEMDYAKPPEGMKYQEIWEAYSAGKSIEFEQNIGIERLRRYSCRDYPGWNMVIPDVLRIDRFLKEFKEFEATDTLPNVMIVYLPQDHLGGGVTSEAHMADNDLAVGRLIEAVSHSKFWEKTVIFINEDDPQNGYDHIDGHRSLCLVISPYSKRGINHSFYNQTSVLRTILHIFGLPPMNQQDGSMPLMADCFNDTADLTPYAAIDANVPLNQTAQPEEKQSAIEKKWRAILATVPIERTGMKTELDESNLNQFVWHEVRGWNTPYPVEWSGAHGKGLKELGLQFDENRSDDD